MSMKWRVATPLLIGLILLGAWFLVPEKPPVSGANINGGVQHPPPDTSIPDKSQSLSFVVQDAADVRLFVEGLPFREPAATQKLMANEKGISLTEGQRAILGQSIQKRRATQEHILNQPGCFDPHHFFRFYDRKGEVFAELAVCYCCGGAKLRGSSAAKIMGDADFIDFDFAAIKEMLVSMKVPTSINCHENARF